VPQVAQVRRIIADDEEIGMGFNSETGLAIGSALEGFTIDSGIASGQEVIASITIINTHEELMKQLGMSFEAQGRYGFFQASARASFAESSNFNSTSTFLVARCVVQNPLSRGKGFRVSGDAAKLLNPAGMEQFTRAFGDSFVRGLQTGGEFYSVTRITSTSTTTQSSLAVTLEAEYNGLAAGGSFQGQFAKSNAETQTSTEFVATMYQKAGSGVTIAPTVEIPEVIARFKAFPAIAKADPVAYEAEVATYDTLPLPVPTPDETDAFVFALRDAREKKLRFIQTRNDLDFARLHPAFFVSPPAAATLREAADVYTKLINAVTDHATALSRGEVTPARVFDPTILSPPIVEPDPIVFTRAEPPASSVPVPDFVGLDSGRLEEGQRCLSFETAEHCRSGRDANGVGLGQDGDVVPIDLPLDAFEFLNLVQQSKMRLKKDPPDVGGAPASPDTPAFVVSAQFPSPGTLVAPGTEVVLQFVPVPPT
jgi:hypothetical protein